MQRVQGARSDGPSANAARFCGALALVTILLVCRGVAQAQEPARPRIWYRSGEGCPSGASFLDMLARRATPAQLAEVGDRIDFVVTLGQAATGSSGRLERQTERGTVALRELQGASCDGVAEALALTLILALDPGNEQAGDAQPAIAPAPAAPAPGAAAAVAPPEPVPPSASSAARREPAAPAPSPSPQSSPGESRSSRARLGVGSLLWTLSEHVPFFGGALFGELASVRPGDGFRPALRLSAQAALSPNGGQDIRLFIGAGELEGCPLVWGSARLRLRPCTAIDLGVIRAASSSPGGTSASGLWAAWATHARLSWEGRSGSGLDVQAGLIVPLTQYDLTVEGPAQTVAKTRALGFATGLGAHWALP